MGGVGNERFQLNEGTLTSGEPGDDLRSIDIRPDFEKVVAMIKTGDYASADSFVTAHWLGRQQQCYEPLGDLYLTMDGQIKPTGYRRWLDLDRAVVGTQWTQDKVVYTREAFASYPDQVIVIRLNASKRGSLNFKAHLSSVHPTARSFALTLPTPLRCKASSRASSFAEPSTTSKEGTNNTATQNYLIQTEAASQEPHRFSTAIKSAAKECASMLEWCSK